MSEQLLLKAGVKKENTEPVPYPELNIRKLKERRIDLFSYDNGVARWLMKKENINPDNYEVVYLLATTDHYFAFHKDTSDILINRFQNELDKIKEEGIHQRILDRYLK